MEAAVSVFEGSMGPVLEKLRFVATEFSRTRGVGKQIGFLRSELAAMHALLRKVAAMEEEGVLVDVQVRAWAREVREMAYDVEDCVDVFTRRPRVAAAGDGSGGGIREFFGRCARFLQTLRSWRQFAEQIDELRNRAVEVGERRERYTLDDGLIACGVSSNKSGVDPRLSALFADEDHLVGIDGPRDELAQWLLEESDPAKLRKVLSIVGFGGLGKTTLANLVYRKIGGDFVCKAFVSVSQKPDLKKILTDCLLQLLRRDDRQIKEDIAAWDEKKIISEMRQHLADKRYLIIIDDVWSTSAWDAIKCAFPENFCSSRTVTTTRIIEVASSCCSCSHDRIYEMETLSYHHSRMLFLKTIFGSNECYSQLQEVSDELLKKCGGLPLAIISISSLLANKPIVKEEWEKVRDSIGSALEKHKNLEGLNTIITLSYNDLPLHLKTCLLYLSIFPEDYKIERNCLCNRWIAEGFILQERGLNLQDVAESYFYDLINKSMVQPVDIGYDGKARGCRVHDIMLELIISKATEENFVTIIGSQSSVADPQYSIRRLSIQQVGQKAALVLGEKDVSHVRSLKAFGLVKYIPHLVQFEVLRVLDLERCMDLEEYDWKSIDKLTHIRYLSLRGTWISKLPSEIVKLYDLETLDLRETQIVDLPVDIIRLTKLQHLLTLKYNKGLTKVPDGIGNMRNLQVLSGFIISISSATAVEDLCKLSSLKELHIQLDAEGYDPNKRKEEVLMSSLCKLGACKLQSLWVTSDEPTPMEFLDSWFPPPCSLQSFGMTTNYYFIKIPKWIAPGLTSLAYLSINLVEVTEGDLSILGELPSLLYLELWFSMGHRETLTVRHKGFQCLKEFNFIHYPFSGPGYLVFDTGTLPKLEKLKIPFSVSMAKGCNFYLGIKHLLCLKYAEVRLCHKDATFCESKSAAAAIRNEATAHPNNPRVSILSRYPLDQPAP